MVHLSRYFYDQRETMGAAFIILLLCGAVVLLPGFAFAAGDNPVGQVLCDVVGWFQGPTGRAIGTLAIIIIGILALMGKVSWGLAIMVVLGIALVFGASELLDLIATDDPEGCGA